MDINITMHITLGVLFADNEGVIRILNIAVVLG